MRIPHFPGLLSAALVVALVTCARALILTGHGNDPVSDRGWPTGALPVANLKTRIAWTEGPPFGGGQWTFYYRGGTAQLQEAITHFARIDAPELDLFLHSGPADAEGLPL